MLQRLLVVCLALTGCANDPATEKKDVVDRRERVTTYYQENLYIIELATPTGRKCYTLVGGDSPGVHGLSCVQK